MRKKDFCALINYWNRRSIFARAKSWSSVEYSMMQPRFTTTRWMYFLKVPTYFKTGYPRRYFTIRIKYFRGKILSLKIQRVQWRCHETASCHIWQGGDPPPSPFLITPGNSIHVLNLASGFYFIFRFFLNKITMQTKLKQPCKPTIMRTTCWNLVWEKVAKMLGEIFMCFYCYQLRKPSWSGHIMCTLGRSLVTIPSPPVRKIWDKKG